MKRRLFAVLLVATMLMSSLTVSATDKNLTSLDPAGSTAVEINGLNTDTSRVALLLKDANTENEKFTIYGISEANSEKALDYTVHNAAGGNLAEATMYTNGFAFAAFSAAGQSVGGSLSLEQNQLLSDTTIANWAGDYLGTINFFTKIVNIGDYS